MGGMACRHVCGQMCLPLTYFGCGLLLQRVEVLNPGDVSSDAPVVELMCRFIQCMILRHWSDNALFEPCREGFHWLSPRCRLGIDVEDVRSAAGAITFSEAEDCAVVQ